MPSTDSTVFWAVQEKDNYLCHLRLWLQNVGPTVHNERTSKMTDLMVLQLMIECDKYLTCQKFMTITSQLECLCDQRQLINRNAA